MSILAAIFTLACETTLALVSAPLASASAAPNLIGPYSVGVLCTSCGGTTFTHDWQIATEDPSTGSFSGTGTSSDGNTESLTGTVAGSSVAITDSYENGYVAHDSGTLAADCSISGSFTDSSGQSGTWKATPQSGQCGTSSYLSNPGFESPLGGTQTTGGLNQTFGNWLAYRQSSNGTLPAEVTAPSPVHSGNQSGGRERPRRRKRRVLPGRGRP